MAKDPRLEKLREMDPVIGTFTAREVVSTPDFVHQTYLEHAETHMSLGNTADYVAGLLRWAQTNKGAVVGAIGGRYGYGKTSMAIHLWHQCDQAGVIAVPPFEWYRLQDIVEATHAWVRYRVGQIQPGARAPLDQIYERYREKSVQEFADEEGMPVSQVQALLERGRIRLYCQPEDVIEFLSEVSHLLESDDLHLYGPIVFTDELQVTMSRYMAEGRSRDEFMQDLFELLNPLINREGSYGLMVGVPLPTEALINDVRADIQQRFQHCNLFIRPNTMYERDFPAVLWQEFASVFEFEDMAGDILPADTLDSVGQIAFRDDLGAGPRTVIEAMRRAIDHFDQTGQCFSPIDLMDAYLSRQIAFDAAGKLIMAVTEVMQSRDVQEIPGGEKVIKLMAAFPMGCPEERFEDYGIQDAKDTLSRRLYSEYLYRFPEGVSLRKLAATERPAEPRFIQLTKDFIQTYAESEREFGAAGQAFRELVIQERLLTSRRADQIEGWIPDSAAPDQYIGTFDRRYPQRRLAVRASLDRDELLQEIGEFGVVFWLGPECDCETCGRIEAANEARTLALFRLNLLRRPSSPLTIPYIEEHGYPMRKITPAFMLALAQHLRANEHLIPEDEKLRQMGPFLRRLVDYSVQLLLGEDLLENSEFDDLSKVGLALPQEVFSEMCRAQYPDYETLITTGRWERAYATYLSVLGAQEITSSVGVLRGNRPLELSEKEVLILFGETRKQTVHGLAENLSSVLEVKPGSKKSPQWVIRFKQHPAEEAFMEALRDSEEMLTRGPVTHRVLGQHLGFALLRSRGYRDEEIETILRMLQARRLVDFDTRRQCFVEVLESPDERRDAILAALSDLAQRAGVLAQIPDFDDARSLAQIDRLKAQVYTCDDIEELDDYQGQLPQLRSELAQFTKGWANKIHSNFDQLRNTTGQVLGASVPSDLNRDLKGEVSWVSELVRCQELLKDMYRRSNSAFREVERKATAAWNAWTGASRNEPAALAALYEANLATRSELKEAEGSLAAAQGYLRSFQAWSNVLNVASRAYREALACATTYREDRFQQELDTIFGQIADRFQKKWLEALPNHEMYADQIKDAHTRIDDWLRDRRDKFMQAKQFYEETLQAFGVRQFNLHASFDPFDPEPSRSNLYGEVLEKTRQHVESLERSLQRHHTETLYADRVMCADVSGPAARVKSARDELARVKGQLHNECVQEQECFAALGEALSELNAALQEVEESLRGILHKRPPTPAEEAILNELQDPRGTDLSVVIANQMREEGAAFSLDEMMQMVTALFKKNQVVIRLERRR